MPTAAQRVPVFIVGCQRSGTTFLADLLGRRLSSVVTPESRFFSEAMERINRGKAMPAHEDFLAQIENHWRFRIWGLDEEYVAIRDRLSLLKDIAAIVFEIVEIYADKHHRRGWHFWIDHTPENVRYGATLSRFFPFARFIHIVRDGRAVANSVLQLPWGPITAAEAAAWWTQRVGFGLALENHLKEKAIRIRYEDLVTDPEEVFNRLCDFLEISDDMMYRREIGFDLPSYTKKQHELVNQTADQQRVQAWRSELHGHDISVFEKHSWDFLEYLSYERISSRIESMSRAERFSRRIKTLSRRLRGYMYDRTKRARASRISKGRDNAGCS